MDTCKTLTDLLADDGIQLIILATPHHTHASLAIEAMEAGRHVVVDKVMCMSATEAEEMIAVSQQRGVMLSVFHNRRWDWGYLTVRKAVEDGLLGEPFLVERAVHRFRASRGWRTSRAESGGPLQRPQTPVGRGYRRSCHLHAVFRKRRRIPDGNQ